MTKESKETKNTSQRVIVEPSPPYVPPHDLKPRLAVIGVGGGGSNAVANMTNEDFAGVLCIVCNTDAQALNRSPCPVRIQIGPEITRGLGAGAKPEVGRAAAEESLEQLMEHIEGVDMLFITAGMGGGTGTGAAPIIAKAAKEKGILTVAVVTKPFGFEGNYRSRAADQGIHEIQQYVDTLLVIPNQNLFRLTDLETTVLNAFKIADSVLATGVRTFIDLMIKPGLINLDFADVSSVMRNAKGKAMMGSFESQGDNRALDAAEGAITSPLLDQISIASATALIVNISSGDDLTLNEVDMIIGHIKKAVANDHVNIIFGVTFDETKNGKVRVSVVATGIETLESIETQYQDSPKKIPEQAKNTPPITPIAEDSLSKVELANNDQTPSVGTVTALDTINNNNERSFSFVDTLEQFFDQNLQSTVEIPPTIRIDHRASSGSAHGGSWTSIDEEPAYYLREDDDSNGSEFKKKSNPTQQNTATKERSMWGGLRGSFPWGPRK